MTVGRVRADVKRGQMDPYGPESEPKFAVVLWETGAAAHLFPRGQRANHLKSALEHYGSVERLGDAALPQWLAGDPLKTGTSWRRRVGKRIVNAILIDKVELDAWKTLRKWTPQVDGAVLVGFPFSPLPIAARQLERAGVPYAVDVGDPWVLTNPAPQGSRFQQWRARRGEARLWRGAKAAIVTTELQADALRRRFSHLAVMVRPNGYDETGLAKREHVVRRRDDKELRLVHYGKLYGQRLGLATMLRNLADSSRWERVVLRQHGSDWEGTLNELPRSVHIEERPALPWPQVVRECGEFDAAVVVGNRNPAQLPSKAVQYLTLPIPRLALVGSSPQDALAQFVDQRPGWGVVRASQTNVASTVSDLVEHPWSADDLAPPPEDAWPEVERQLADFVLAALAGNAAQRVVASG